MVLEQIYINRQGYGSKQGQYAGTCTFSNDHCKVEVGLTADKANQIVLMCADGIADAAKATGEVTRDAIKSSVLLLENKVEA